MRRTDWDVVVVGLGALGSAAAYWASRRPGVRVLGLEQYELGHSLGASQDVSRIIRLSYHRRDYVRLARRAYATWAEVERESGTTILFPTGGLDVGPREKDQGVEIDLDAYIGSMRAEQVPFEVLDSGEVMRRFPAWRLRDEHMAVFQPDAGLADPSRGNVAHRELAAAQGATLRDGTRVARIEARGHGEVGLELDGGNRFTAGRVILAADSWTNELLEPLGARLPLTITQEQVSWFTPRVDPALFAPERFPVWIWMHEPSFYGFPTHGHPGPKIGQDVGGREVTNATRTFDRDEAAHGRVMAFLEQHLPGMAVEPFLTKTCLYTLTPDRDFVVDALPEHPYVHVVLGSAHAYKFASVLGRILVERALDGASPSDPELRGFAFDRPILRGAGARRTFVL
ncbi:MAG TPA: N-methyl-L-tryptophan oxidase [Candidatus Limnocylindrales bacterium]|nr:N-methyl-L-tryptophan oxidase [Candidatus Limnocylindrales bacterium]